VDTNYDALGRVYTVSNPYASTSDPTYGLTTYGYDALNRATSVEAPDGSTTSTTYTGNCSTAKDPALKQRTLCSDGLGRVNSVTEDPTGLDYQTTYSYDALDNLKLVTQGGQTRTYAYDMLSRLTSAKGPEASVGTTQCATTYGYDANGNLTSKVAPLANQITSCTNTLTTTYAYDALNELLSKTYSDGTPPATFSYGQTSVTIGSWSSGTLNYPLGRMTEAATTSGGSVQTAVVYSYDPKGRTKDFWQCNPSNCGASSIWSTQYNYDQAGDITSWVHPGGFTLTNTVNAAQQVTAIQSSWVDSNHPQYLAQSISYTPWGAVSQLANGCAGSSCTNAQETYAYNKQLQPAIIELGTTSNATADYCLVYNYYGTSPTSCALPSPGTNNNGNVMGYWYQDSVNSSFSHTASYTYDGVKRLATAVATGNATYNLTFKYDAYGNMTCVTNAQTNGPCPNWAYNTSTNQLSTSGFSYDAAGNLTKDSSNPTAHTYQWDAEGRVASVDSGSTWGFTYNALADRAQWAYTGGADQHLFDPAGTWLGNAGSYSLVGLGGQYLALYLGGDTLFNHINALGSASMRTNHSGAEAEDILFYPWGDVWGLQGSGGYNFAEMPYNDTNTNTNLATFRLQSPGLGRWLSPDPLGGRITNPQSLNRYAYGLNNPTTLVDPLGLGPCGPMSAQIAKSTGKTADCVGDPSSSGGGGSCDPLNDPDCPGPYPCDPTIDPDCDPWGGGGGDSGGEPPSGGSTGSSAGGTGQAGEAWLGYPCNVNLGYLINQITIGLTGLFGNAGKGQITRVGVQGGAEVFSVPNITPTKDFETDWPKLNIPGTMPGKYQIYYPVPDKGVGGTNGVGDVLHVEFDTVTDGAGRVTQIKGVTAHFDISNPMKGHGLGLPGHLLFDWGFARISQALCGGGPVKFE